MVHDQLLRAVAPLVALRNPLADGGDASNIKVALITGAFLLAATFITVLGQHRDRGESEEHRTQQRNYTSQVHRAERAERARDEALREVGRLRELVRALGHDPDEDPDAVRSPA